jgi:hypothetical protein
MTLGHAPRAESLSAKPHCDCGEDRKPAMTRHGRCYECDRLARGKSPYERHHYFGPDVPVTVPIPGNTHRVLTKLAANRREALKRPSDNPLLAVAAFVATAGETAEAAADYARRRDLPAWIVTIAALIARAARSASDWLLWLDGWLSEELGPDWHKGPGVPLWQP